MRTTYNDDYALEVVPYEYYYSIIETSLYLPEDIPFPLHVDGSMGITNVKYRRLKLNYKLY